MKQESLTRLEDTVALTYLLGRPAEPELMQSVLEDIGMEGPVYRDISTLILKLRENRQLFNQIFTEDDEVDEDDSSKPDYFRNSRLFLRRQLHQFQLGQIISGKLSTTLLVYLARNTVLVEQYGEEVGFWYDRTVEGVKDQFPVMVESLFMNGREVNIPAGTKVVIAKNATQIEPIHRELMDGSPIDMLVIPKNSLAHSDWQNLYILFKPQNDDTYTPSSESLLDLQLKLAITEDLDPLELFAYTERYLNRGYRDLEHYVAFISWAKLDLRTTFAAERMTEKYRQFINTEIFSNFSKPHYSIKSPLSRLSGVPLPDFSYPSKEGRATGYLSFEEHLKLLAKVPKRKRSVAELQQEMLEFYSKPLERLSLYH